jgi:hypothetical protein
MRSGCAQYRSAYSPGGNQVSFFLGELVIQHGCNPFPGRMRRQLVSPLPTPVQKVLHLLCESTRPNPSVNRTRRFMLRISACVSAAHRLLPHTLGVMNNPWLDVPLADYEGHMALPGIEQAQLLSGIFADVLAKFSPRSVAVIGCAGGNGFDRISPSISRVVGVI